MIHRPSLLFINTFLPHAAVSELQDMSTSHETKMSKLREVTSGLSLQVSSLEKELVLANRENEALQNQLEALAAEQNSSKQKLEQVMKESEAFQAACNKEREMIEQEREEFLMQIIELEAAVRSPRQQLHQELCDTSSQTDPCVTGSRDQPGTITEEQLGSQEESQPVPEEKQLILEAGQVEIETLRKLVSSLKDEVCVCVCVMMVHLLLKCLVHVHVTLYDTSMLYTAFSPPYPHAGQYSRRCSAVDEGAA